MSRVLVTGINGFVGEHVCDSLAKRNVDIVGVGREPNPPDKIANKLADYFCVDLTRPTEVERIVLDNTDAIINLAGLAKVGESFKNPDKYMKVNVAVLTIIGERVLKEGVQPRLIAISTGAVYDSLQHMPLDESSKLAKNSSPYVDSKLEMEKAAFNLRKKGVDCVIVRPFNHTGPGQGPGFLLPDLYQKIIDAKSSGSPIKIGNLDTKRDYTDVRDVARAYADLALASELKHDLYNVCSGRSIAGKDILMWVQQSMGASVLTEVDASLLRPNDPEEIFGSYNRLNTDTGWRPKIKIEDTIEAFVQRMLSTAAN